VAASAAIEAVAGAAVASAVPVVGWVVAAVLLVVAAALAIFSGPKEGHVYLQIQQAFDSSGVETAATHFVQNTIGGVVDYMGALATRAGKDGSAMMAASRAAFMATYGNAAFDLAAGDPKDLQGDVNQFFSQTLPTLVMKAGFGQTGPPGNRDATGGIAGMDWNLNNPGKMDAAGNWIGGGKLFDKDAPIPKFLDGIGVSQEKIAEIATKLASGGDIKAFQTYLLDFVGVVTDLSELSKKFGQSTEDWRTALAKARNEQGTAASFKTSIDNLKAQGTGIDTMTPEDQVAAAKGLVTASQAVLQNMASALQAIFDMQEAIKKTTADTIQSYKDKLLKPSEIEAQSRADYTRDVAAIATAANPKDVQAAWQQVMKDLSTTLDAIVARINAIKSLQQSYADFRTQMAKDAGPQFGTDPTAWLADNQKQIDAVTLTLKTATGDDAIAGAKTLLQLTQERYQNELNMLGRVNSAISSISEIGKTTSDNLKMQAMGHVETDAQGNKKWVADTHAQGDYLKGQYDDLMKQLGSAKTPEEVQKIYSKLQGVISQLAAQPQDPEHYAESRQILGGMNDAATQAATDLLKKWGKTLEDDLGGTGDKLKAGETALADALAAAQKDFTDTLALMSDASTRATSALGDMADDITVAMQQVAKVIEHWTFVVTNPAGTKDPNWDYDKNAPKDTSGGGGGATTPAKKDEWGDDPDDETLLICTACYHGGATDGNGPDKGTHKRKPGKPGRQPNSQTAPGSPANATTPGGAPGDGGTDADKAAALKKQMDDLSKSLANTPPSIAVTVNSGSPEDIANAVADAVYAETLDAIQKNNVNLVRAIRENPVLVKPPGGQASV
jgi:hypothetical protein